MKLSKIYTNRPSLFEPVIFNDGLNVIYGEMRLNENKDKDTHNLGKSTLGRLIDFTLLSKKDPQFFLFKHPDVFNNFVFFLEIKLSESSYLTIRRGVSQQSKICFKMHDEKKQDFSSLSIDSWDHSSLPFNRAKKLLDGILDLSAIKRWDYRKGLGYFIRTQDDYTDVFYLGAKFRKSKDAQWKPYMAHLLGFDSVLVEEHYQKETELKEKKAFESTVKNELGGSIEDISKIEGILLLKNKESEKKQTLLDQFDFRQQDKEITAQLVDEIDSEIARLNQQRYSLYQSRKKITASLKVDKVNFKPDEAEKLFQDAGVFFSGQIKRDFEQLVDFNKSITNERDSYLAEERSEIDIKLETINKQLDEFGKRRSDSLSFLSDNEIFTKYKSMSNDLVSLRTDIEALERKKESLQKLQQLRAELRALSDECSRIQSKIEKDIELNTSNKTSLISQIRLYFNEIIEAVINRKALLNVYPNTAGHLEFQAEILDESGNTTSADMGNSYRKLLCIAFDLSILRAYSDKRFTNFVFHDGIFESLDDRKKENLLTVLHDYVSIGIQSIITLIDSDLPARECDESSIFNESEIVLKLNDSGERGRLFKMKAW